MRVLIVEDDPQLGDALATGLRQLQHGGHRRLQALDAPVRNRHAMPQTRGAQTLACKQAIGHCHTSQALLIFKQQTQFFKSAFFAGDLGIQDDVRDGQNSSKAVHTQIRARAKSAIMP